MGFVDITANAHREWEGGTVAQEAGMTQLQTWHCGSQIELVFLGEDVISHLPNQTIPHMNAT